MPFSVMIDCVLQQYADDTTIHILDVIFILFDSK